MSRVESAQHRLVCRPRRGVALLLVLGVVAAASVLSWAMLSSAALRARLDVNTQDVSASKYLADSGISYAMYYLRYPEKSPVALTNGPYNNFYAGQSNVSLWEDAGGLVNIVVTNTSLNTFLIRSTSLVRGITQTAEAEVTLTLGGYKAESAVAFNGPVTLPLLPIVTGPVVAGGVVTSYAGTTVTSFGSFTVAHKTNPVPAMSDLLIVSETGEAAPIAGTDRTYKIDGVDYVAEKAPATIAGTLLTSRPSLNPANVWWSEDDVILNGATINGTLIVRSSGKGVELQGTNTVTAANPKLPALVVGKDLMQRHATVKPARLTAKGVTWIGGKASVAGTSILPGSLTFEGSLLMASNSPKFDDLTGPVTFTHTVAAETAQLTEATTITGITVNRWSHLK